METILLLLLCRKQRENRATAASFDLNNYVENGFSKKDKLVYKIRNKQNIRIWARYWNCNWCKIC